MIAFLSLIQLNLPEVAYFDRDKAALLESFAKNAGHDPTKFTRAQTEQRELLQKSNPSTFTTGFLYSDFQIVSYAPEKLLIPNEFIAAQQMKFKETGFNDCLSYSVNQLVRYRFFIMREQI